MARISKIGPESLILMYLIVKKEAEERKLMRDLYNIGRKLEKKGIESEYGYLPSLNVPYWNPDLSSALTSLEKLDIIDVSKNNKKTLVFKMNGNTKGYFNILKMIFEPKKISILKQTVQTYI